MELLYQIRKIISVCLSNCSSCTLWILFFSLSLKKILMAISALSKFLIVYPAWTHSCHVGAFCILLGKRWSTLKVHHWSRYIRYCNHIINGIYVRFQKHNRDITFNRLKNKPLLLFIELGIEGEGERGKITQNEAHRKKNKFNHVLP